MASTLRVLVMGGSGRTGRLVINELLSRGHTVTALVRNPSTMPSNTARLITGTPTSASDVQDAFSTSQPHVVIVTLNAVRASDSPFAANISPPRLMANSAAHIVSAMKGAPSLNTKLVVLQAFGVAESWPNLHCVMRLLMRSSNMIYQYRDHDAVAREVRESGVEFVMVRPARLVSGSGSGSGEKKEVRVWESDGKGMPMMATCSRESVAVFLVDVAEGKKWNGKVPVITD